MDEMQELEKKRLKEGWIKASMMIEALAVSEETAKSSLEKHIEMMEKDKRIILTRKEFKGIKLVDNPVPGIEKAFSNLVEVEILTSHFETLVYVSMTYGPTSIEILNPDKIKIDIGEAQGILNTVAEMVHRFVSLKGGGLLVDT